MAQEFKIGEIIQYNKNTKLQVVKKDGCHDCFFLHKPCLDYECRKSCRSDGTKVIFQQISNTTNTIDYSKFRFRIGDKILYEGKEYTILAYYFSIEFNDYTRYGYTINKPCHKGAMNSYSETGQKLGFKEESAFYITEEKAQPLSSISTSLPSTSSIITSSDFSKAKPGDKVRVKERIKDAVDYLNCFTDEMASLVNNIYTIHSIKLHYDDSSQYEIILEEVRYYWTDEMLELVQDTPTKSTNKPNLIQKIKSIFINSEDIQANITVKQSKPNLNFKL